MSFDSTYYARALGSDSSIPELSRVALTAPQPAEDGRMLPEGSEGTIVGTWARGEAYEVEFAAPVVGNCTVSADLLRAA